MSQARPLGLRADAAQWLQKLPSFGFYLYGLIASRGPQEAIQAAQDAQVLLEVLPTLVIQCFCRQRLICRTIESKRSLLTLLAAPGLIPCRG